MDLYRAAETNGLSMTKSQQVTEQENRIREKYRQAQANGLADLKLCRNESGAIKYEDALDDLEEILDTYDDDSAHTDISHKVF